MIIIIPIDLIGDYLGTIPATTAFIRANKHKEIIIVCHPAVRSLNELLPADYKSLARYELPNTENEETITLDIQRAFSYSHPQSRYMGECYYEQFGMEQGTGKAELVVHEEVVPAYDYLISPFSRCLPPEQKISQQVWQKLVDSNPDKSFAFLGTSKHDDIDYLKGKNVEVFFDKSWNQVCNAILKTKLLLSVVTGTSHLAYHLGANNLLVSNQDYLWGTNPASIKKGTIIKKTISKISAKDIQQQLNKI